MIAERERTRNPKEPARFFLCVWLSLPSVTLPEPPKTPCKMSDFEDDDFMHEDDEQEDYDFDYEDEDEDEEEPDVDMENKYYNAKGRWNGRVCVYFPRVAMKEDNPKEALQELEQVVEMEPEKGEW